MRVHAFAEANACGEGDNPSDQQEARIAAFLDGLSGTSHAEQSAVLPLDFDGVCVTIRGVVDLVHVTDDTVEIIDYKIDTSRQADHEYRKQLSVYYHVPDEWFTGKEIIAAFSTRPVATWSRSSRSPSMTYESLYRRSRRLRLVTPF